MLLSSDRFVADDLLSSLYSQLQSLPTPDTASSKDILEYVRVMCLCALCYLKQHNEEPLRAVIRGVVGYFASADSAVHKAISLYLIDFFASLKTVLPKIGGVWLRGAIERRSARRRCRRWCPSF